MSTTTAPEEVKGPRAHLRAAFVAFHLFAVVVLSLPGTTIARTPRAWDSAHARRDLSEWAARMRTLGFDVSDDEFREGLMSIAKGWADFHDVLKAPVVPYARAFGVRQGWQMFSSPQRHPAELHVDVELEGTWVPVFRPEDPGAQWRAFQLRHNRVRKMIGRFARYARAKRWRALSQWLGWKALEEHPEATRVRVRLYRYDSLKPAEVRAGAEPPGRYSHTRVFGRKAAP